MLCCQLSNVKLWLDSLIYHTSGETQVHLPLFSSPSNLPLFSIQMKTNHMCFTYVVMDLIVSPALLEGGIRDRNIMILTRCMCAEWWVCVYMCGCQQYVLEVFLWCRWHVCLCLKKLVYRHGKPNHELLRRMSLESIFAVIYKTNRAARQLRQRGSVSFGGQLSTLTNTSMILILFSNGTVMYPGG